MWAQIESRQPVLPTSEELRVFLASQENGADATWAAKSAAMLLQAGRDFEAFVGGDESQTILQLLGAPGPGGDLDVVCTILLPTEPVQTAGTARGPEALQLLAAFWERHPSAPLLVPRGAGHAHVTCSLATKEWTMAPLSAQHIGKLRALAETDEDRICVQVPVPSSEEAGVQNVGGGALL